MKGFVITIDGIIALIVTFSILVMVSSQALRAGPGAWSDTHVKRLSMDSLTILEKSGALARAVELNSSSELLYFMSSELPSLCAKIKLSGADEFELSAAKQNCSKQGRFFISRRSFILQNKFYLAEIEAWER